MEPVDKTTGQKLKKTDPNAGHRIRLRERFFATGAESLQDYELLELLLFAAIPRRDTKPLAKKLLAAFGGLWPLLNAPVERLKVFGLSDSAIALLRVTAAAGQRALKTEVLDKPLLKSWQAILDYCRLSMGAENKEQFRLLFLDRKNRLLGDEVQQRGTIDHTPVYPREVVQRALELGAGAIVMAHNHPSGDPAPSREDIEMTRAVQAACQALGILLHDHIIIGQGGAVASFKNLGVL